MESVSRLFVLTMCVSAACAARSACAQTASQAAPQSVPHTVAQTASPTPSQAFPRSTSLTVAGQPGQAPIVHVNGRSYVDVEAITRLLDGSLRFQGTRVVLTLPSQQAAVPASAPAPVPVVTASPGLSRDFVSTGVGAVSVMREWHAALAFAIGHDQPVTEDLLAPYERRAQAQVQLAFAAARTDDDRAAGTLYSNLLGSLQALSNSYVSTHDQIRNIRTDALDNDTANTAAVQCLATLGSLNPGMRADEISACH